MRSTLGVREQPEPDFRADRAADRAAASAAQAQFAPDHRRVGHRGAPDRFLAVNKLEMILAGLGQLLHSAGPGPVASTILPYCPETADSPIHNHVHLPGRRGCQWRDLLR